MHGTTRTGEPFDPSAHGIHYFNLRTSCCGTILLNRSQQHPSLAHAVSLRLRQCLSLSLQTRVMDGTRVRAIPQVDKVECVAWHPTAHVLAWSNEDKAAPRAEHNAVRVLIPTA